ncbi:hypothetical protein DMA15_26520 [Streptomyces sp. WAC 01529]|nr:hypothetical protein DMA15_26520 [Streptomyces sp. WAC 01529]
MALRPGLGHHRRTAHGGAAAGDGAGAGRGRLRRSAGAPGAGAGAAPGAPPGQEKLMQVTGTKPRVLPYTP